MARITEELVRKRSEHNDGEIGTLEEIALHQEDIVAIEHLQNWCRNLKILLLQSNLISKLENLSKLKKLEYLNLALNNIAKIENLEGCECLQKLDLTLNFIGELTSVQTLRKNLFLQDLYLSGNPCTDYRGYREYVIVTLPQITSLDGKEIERSERIQALQIYNEIKKTIKVEQQQYHLQRIAKRESKQGCIIRELEDTSDEDENPEEKLKQYWSQPCDNSPETRVELANTVRKQKEKTLPKLDEKPPKRTYRLFNAGRPLNVNEAKIPFTLTEDENENCLVLDIELYKHLDTSYIDIDIQPMYVKILIKGKIFQVVLNEEIKPDSSTAQRSITTGNLLLRMPRVNGEVVPKIKSNRKEKKAIPCGDSSSKRELLEIGRGDVHDMDFSRIVENAKIKRNEKHAVEDKRELPLDFVDDPEVPPLE